jgi:VCBS repeat-containing protein
VGEGTLDVAAGTTGVVVTDSGTSCVTLGGTVAQVNALLAGNLGATATYTNTSDTPSVSTTLMLAVDDLGNTGSGGSLTAADTATINITDVNDAPTATITPPSYSANEQVALTLHGTGLSISDLDDLGTNVEVTLSVGEGTLDVAAGTTGVGVANSGTDSVTLTGTVAEINALLAGNLGATATYTNTSDTPSASTTLTLTVDDLGNTGSGGALTANDTATINIVSSNDAPVTSDDHYTVDEDTTLSESAATGVLANDSDIEGHVPLMAQVVNGTQHGTLTLNTDGSLSYTPNENFVGTDQFTYQATDTSGGASQATVTIEVLPHNDAPVANAQAYQTTTNEPLNVTAVDGVLANDTDVEGSTLSSELVSGPAHGTLVLKADGSFQYIPTAGFFGDDSFEYRASDGELQSDVCRVSIHVEGQPYEPPEKEPPSEESSDPLEETSDSNEQETRSESEQQESANQDLPLPVAPQERGFEQSSNGPARTSDGVAAIKGEANENAALTPIALNVGTFNDGAGDTGELMRRLSDGNGYDDALRVASDSTEPSNSGWNGQNDAFFAFAGSKFNRALDDLEESLANQDFQFRVIVGAVTGVTTAFTVGYVLWALKGGYLLASLLSSLPAWATFDPLPILDNFDEPLQEGRRREDCETLESILQNNSPATGVGDGGV